MVHNLIHTWIHTAGGGGVVGGGAKKDLQAEAEVVTGFDKKLSLD